MRSEPTVSVIISAYNRPQVIPFAILSVIDSQFDDWELIVVGDGCNDETEAAVQAFTDPRIRFENLPSNTGHQSAPHNRGVEMACGKYVLFLNQDDMYFPDHIDQRVAFMEETGAQVSWSPVLLLQRSGQRRGPANVDKDRLTLDGAVADGHFNPRSFIISSSWAVRREICAEVGPWLPIHQTRLSPSQEWLFRAFRQGRHMAYHPHVSVLCIHSGVRQYSYVSARSHEHERAWSWLEAGPAERLNLMHCMAVQRAAEVVGLKRSLEKRRRWLHTPIVRALEKIGIHPDSTDRFLRGVAKGGWVNDHTRFTTQPPEMKPGEKVSFSMPDSERLLGSNWHPAEQDGRWTADDAAEIYFSVPGKAGGSANLKLLVCGHPLRRTDSVAFSLNDATSIEWAVEGDNEIVELSLDGPGAYCLRIEVENPTTPRALQLSDDDRILGYQLNWIEIVPMDNTGG